MVMEASTIQEEKISDQEIQLRKISTTLEVLLELREKEKADIYKKISSRIKKNAFPFLERIKTEPLSSNAQTCLTVIEKNLEEIVYSNTNFKALTEDGFTPTEIHIIELIKQGKRSKEIADLLHVSTAAISFHRNNIREKLRLNNKKENLFAYLNA